MTVLTDKWSGRVLGQAALLGLVHAVVDFGCLALLAAHRTAVLATADEGSGGWPVSFVWTLYLIYYTLAFGTQFSIGAVIDRVASLSQRRAARAYRETAVAGLVLVGLGIPLAAASPLAGVVSAGLGNAAFHVGAGALVLKASPRRAAAAGLFVAPGGIGLVLGGWAGGALSYWPWLAVAMLAASVWPVWRMDIGETGGASDHTAPIPLSRLLLVGCLAALWLSIAVRGGVGLVVGKLYSQEFLAVTALAVAGCIGKGSGGFVSDRFGWIKTSVLALLLSAPLIAFSDPLAGATAGMLLFQMTMPVTLLAVYRALPDEPGFAFGLTTLALLAGAVPVFVLPLAGLAQGWLLMLLITVSVAALLIGLPPVLRSR